jgi:hypothetical protein
VATGRIYISFFLLALVIIIGFVAAAQKIWAGKEI